MSDIDSILKKIEQLTSEIENLKKENLDLKKSQEEEEKRKALLSYNNILASKTRGKMLDDIVKVLKEEGNEIEPEDFEKDGLRKLNIDEIVNLYREGKIPKIN